MEIPLDPEIEAVVRRKVETGEYPSVAALIEEALMLLVERDWQESRKALFQRIGDDLLPRPDTEAER